MITEPFRLTSCLFSNLSQAVHRRQNWRKCNSSQRGSRRSKNERRTKASSMQRDRRWTRQKYLPSLQFRVFCSHGVQISDAVKRYSYLLGQTDLFKYFVDIKVTHVICAQHLLTLARFQKARDPQYAALFDAQPKQRGRGRRKPVCVSRSPLLVTCS